MKAKWPLFIGILLLTLGIILKVAAIAQPLPLILILTGVAFKIFYIISKIVKGEYQPGFEIALLFIGLTIFLTGIYFKNHESAFHHFWLTIPGLTLKASFVVLFIIKSRTPQLKPKDGIS